METQGPIILGIASLSTMYLVKKLQLDPGMSHGLIYGIVMGLLMLANNNSHSFWEYFQSKTNWDFEFDLSYTYSILVILFIVSGLYYLKNYMKVTKNNSCIIKIHDNQMINYVVRYLIMHKKTITNDYNINIGDYDNIFQKKLILARPNTDKKDAIDAIDETFNDSLLMPECDSPLNFFDESLNIKGQMYWRKRQEVVKDEKSETKITIKYLELHIDKDTKPTIDVNDIVPTMKKIVLEMENNISLHYIKVMNGYNHDIIFYDGPKYTFDGAESKYIHSFFHQERDRLWEIVKNIHLNPDYFIHFGQAPHINMLLHGPPGTGKSTFAFRIAMCLQRHIVSLDLQGMSKQGIYQIVQKPNIRNNNEINMNYKSTIVMFEEFDTSVKELHKKEIHNNKILDQYMKCLVPSSMETETDSNTNDATIKNPVENIKNKFLSIKNNFILKDLLELLQGPVPLNGSIIIATTNEFDEIQKLCPALFRPGRLTPVHFGYITKDVLQDMTKFYFGSKLKMSLPETIKIPTSEIIELALECAMSEDKNKGFEAFQQRLTKLIKMIK